MILFPCKLTRRTQRVLVLHPLSLILYLFLPIPYAAVLIEHALRQLLLEWMLGDLCLVDFDAQARAAARTNDAALLLDGEAFLDHIAAPGHVGVNGLADDVA